jgi:hypothetical protein
MSMQISYNGITLDMVTIHNWTREPILDGTTYLYSRHTLTISAVINPATVSYVRNGDNLAAQPGQQGWATDKAIKSALETPRGKLLVYMDGTAAANKVLESPPPADDGGGRYLCDATNGPFTTVYGFQANSNLRTFIVSLTVRTDLVEDEYIDDKFRKIGGIKKNPYVISHRWEMKRSRDEAFFESRTITGHAVLRADKLKRDGRQPDEFFRELMHRCPVGFKRETEDVRVVEDGTTLHYTLVDVERKLHLWNDVASKIEVFDTYGCTQSSAWDLLAGMANAIAGRASGATAGVNSANSSAKGMAGGAAQAAIGVFSDISKLMPVIQRAIQVRVWGKRRTSLNGLMEIAKVVAATRLTIDGVQPSRKSASSRLSMTKDVSGRYFELSLTLTEEGVFALLNRKAQGNILLQSFLQETPTLGVVPVAAVFGAVVPSDPAAAAQVLGNQIVLADRHTPFPHFNDPSYDPDSWKAPMINHNPFNPAEPDKDQAPVRVVAPVLQDQSSVNITNPPNPGQIPKGN